MITRERHGADRRGAVPVAAAAAALTLVAACGGAVSGVSQFGLVGNAVHSLGTTTPGLSSALQGEPPITTSLGDARFADAARDNWSPANFAPLDALARTPTGGFILEVGAYQWQGQSYCLKAGTHGPGGGDGYLYAPPKGPAEEAVISIVQKAAQQPEIPQGDIQLLLWAIIARAKFEDLDTSIKATALALLSPRQLATLNRTGVDAIPDSAMQRALAEAPPLLRQTLEAEARLRRMLTSTGSSFSEIERVAVLSGVAPQGEGSLHVPSGRWSRHPDDYYVRYLPSSYKRTLVQIWVPERSEAIGKAFDPALHIAVPGNTSRQRLIQSGRPH